MKKILAILVIITSQNLFHASTFNDILSEEDNLKEYEKMWNLYKQHFRTKININDKELKILKNRRGYRKK